MVDMTKVPPVQQNERPDNDDTDGKTDILGGAARFMGFANVDAYHTMSSSVVHNCAAHFAEAFVMAPMLKFYTSRLKRLC